ncbi:hypothetical protein [Polynucleobacter necessarius]|uniref:hypothetical protein n=1 Tax=Polynucleobacter necessarius TaxID=576610 RepID=UPI000E09AE0B|nr:hypothetical protein [Polynucleobacter necessarius]
MFAKASAREIAGIVFIYQTDMFYSSSQSSDAESGYRDTLLAFTKGAQELRKPILLIHGDSHRLIINQPLKTENQKDVIENVIRLQVMGDKQVQAEQIEVNPKAEQPFGFNPLLLKANMMGSTP